MKAAAAGTTADLMNVIFVASLVKHFICETRNFLYVAKVNTLTVAEKERVKLGRTGRLV